ncbi:MAG: LysR substrate-binding domain-containing protein [Proteobacteria bacterium]|nr:LysR substrate-binding domain-containing protein [Pseudomonadota bacterium]
MTTTRTPSLNTLLAFEAAARHGSFVKAAAELHVTAAAISHRVKSLEEQLGVVLFRRKARGIELTEVGRRYRNRIASAFQIIERATADLDQVGVEGPLIVSTPESFAQFWLIPRLRRLVHRFPELQLTVAGDSRLSDLRDDQTDIGIRYGMGRYPGLSSEYLFGDAVTLLVSAESMSDKTDTRAGTMLRENILLEDYGTAPNEPWMTWQPWIREAGMQSEASHRKLRFPHSGLAVLACRESAGICIGRMSLVYDLVRQRELRALMPWRSTEFAYHLVTRPRDAENPRILAFRTWLIEEIDTYVGDVHRVLGFEVSRPGE